MFKESLHNVFWILEIEFIRTNTRHFPEVNKKRGNFPVAAPRAYSGKPLLVVEDAEAKVLFEFVFDCKMKVLVVVNNLFLQLLKKFILSPTGQIW